MNHPDASAWEAAVMTAVQSDGICSTLAEVVGHRQGPTMRFRPGPRRSPWRLSPCRRSPRRRSCGGIAPMVALVVGAGKGLVPWRLAGVFNPPGLAFAGRIREPSTRGEP
jgi:hypothetical protein